MTNHQLKIYQAPVQGFTDFTFRATLSEVFGGVDKFFIPYLSYGKGREVKKSQLREVFPENNGKLPVVPQVLFSDQEELFDLIQILLDYGYEEINLNLGCPYPMATNRGRGAAWLEKPGELNEILHQLFAKNFPAKFSVKMRAGLRSDQEAKAIFEVINQFPIGELIFHPRTASQMYDGKANPLLFAEALPLVKPLLVYNGDICCETDLEELKKAFPEQIHFMIGRGLLSDPSFPSQLKGRTWNEKELKLKKKEFHDMLFEAYSTRLDGSGHILAKMNQFWSYYCQSFENPHKVMKLVKKAGTLAKYHAAVVEIFRSY